MYQRGALWPAPNLSNGIGGSSGSSASAVPYYHNTLQHQQVQQQPQLVTRHVQMQRVQTVQPPPQRAVPASLRAPIVTAHSSNNSRFSGGYPARPAPGQQLFGVPGLGPSPVLPDLSGRFVCVPTWLIAKINAGTGTPTSKPREFVSKKAVADKATGSSEGPCPDLDSAKNEVTSLYLVFRWLDTDGVGTIDPLRAGTGMLRVSQQWGLPPPPESWLRKSLECNCASGLLDFEEFVDIAVQWRDENSSMVSAVTSNAMLEGSTTASSVPTGSTGSIDPHWQWADSVLHPESQEAFAVFDAYTFMNEEHLACGRFGKVAICKHNTTGAERACKAVSIRNAVDEELVAAEIETLKCVRSHPNIIELHETFRDGSNTYMIMELCIGGTITEALANCNGTLTEGVVRRCTRQLLSALAHCHNRHVIHRDVKPDNVVFLYASLESPLKLIDFGLATTQKKLHESKRVVKEPRKGALGMFAKMLPTVRGKHLLPLYVSKKRPPRAGTKQYMAPELWAGKDYGEAVDIWALGCVLWQLLSGFHPFLADGDDEPAVAEKILGFSGVRKETQMWMQVCPEPALDLLASLLTPKPDKRVTASEALSHSWLKTNTTRALPSSAIEGLKAFAAKSVLERAVLYLVSREVTGTKLRQLHSEFAAADQGGDGFLGLRSLLGSGSNAEGCEELPDLEAMAAALRDADQGPPARAQSGEIPEPRIGYKAYCAAMLGGPRLPVGDAEMRAVFQRLAVDGAGKPAGQITVEGLKHLLQYPEDVDVVTILDDASACSGLNFFDFKRLIEQDPNNLSKHFQNVY